MDSGDRCLSPTTCPPRRALDLIADKWSVVVVYALAERLRRAGELRRAIAGVSQKVLTETLRGLEANGFVARTVSRGVPPAVEYALTPLGRSLADLLTGLNRWAERHLPDVDAARGAHLRQVDPA